MIMTTLVSLFLLTTFIATNPGFVAWLLGGLVTVIGGLLVGYYGFIGRRISNLEDADQKLESRLSGVEKSLEGYKEHVGAGDKELKEMAARMDGMKELGKQLSGIQLENAEAHAQIGERIARVETKLPNGEFSKMIQLLTELVADQDRRYHEAPRNEQTRVRPPKRRT